MARILIADDDPSYHQAFYAAVEVLGHEAVGVASSDKVVPALKEQRFDILFLDVLMPGGGAISTIHAVRAVDADLPIVIITGNAAVFDSPIVSEGLRMAQARVPKTAGLDDLRRVIDDLLA
ncbi:two-component response regulator [Oceanicola granulosus HTCC2516]|uniref:Two-component response regulator n=1 Tax=Oceanicola granulosus (strain ATCC BAA-861 / DSM 15982 / KCTC 12143 / HTCC2516) TaxID=314256 RepID=Q2CDX8_OCEGH|nr:response regulator [Oceanicola granulosus]EAR50850.1 two-component response regulator [Oceanicola granulosus HTCC2516]